MHGRRKTASIEAGRRRLRTESRDGPPNLGPAYSAPGNGPKILARHIFGLITNFCATSPSIFNASEGVGGEPYRISDSSRVQRPYWVGLVCQGFTVDIIESLGPETGSPIEKILGFPDIGGPDWALDLVYTHIRSQGRWDALIRCALADHTIVPKDILHILLATSCVLGQTPPMDLINPPLQLYHYRI